MKGKKIHGRECRNYQHAGTNAKSESGRTRDIKIVKEKKRNIFDI